MNRSDTYHYAVSSDDGRGFDIIERDIPTGSEMTVAWIPDAVAAVAEAMRLNAELPL